MHSGIEIHDLAENRFGRKTKLCGLRVTVDDWLAAASEAAWSCGAPHARVQPVGSTSWRTKPAAPVVTAAGRSYSRAMAATSFVGRRQELSTVLRLVSDHRLVTLTGVGGCGKTRLALEAAARFEGSASVVELAPLDESELVAAAVSRAVGVRDEPGRESAAVLVNALRTRELLLVLDNCEHVLEGAAELV